tara:strand:+ start:47 stop:310 length:264 start_codon:yes stop_codon:yes gene_type:complete
MKRNLQAYTNYISNCLEFDKKIDRQEASRIIRTIVLEIMEDWVDGKGGNFNLQLAKIVNFLNSMMATQLPKEQILKQLEDFLNQEVA